MVKVCLCYNSSSELLDGTLKNFLQGYQNVVYESWNEDIHSERKKAFGVKGHFAARQTPFCGVWVNDKACKGFYSEAKECEQTQITNYLATICTASKNNIPDFQ